MPKSSLTDYVWTPVFSTFIIHPHLCIFGEGRISFLNVLFKSNVDHGMHDCVFLAGKIDVNKKVTYIYGEIQFSVQLKNEISQTNLFSIIKYIGLSAYDNYSVHTF